MPLRTEYSTLKRIKQRIYNRGVLYRFFPLLMLFLITGCATRSGKLNDTREYIEYDVLFDRDRGRFYVPLKWIKDQEYEYNKDNGSEEQYGVSEDE